MTNFTSKSTTLIFDVSLPAGHHIEYLQYLIDYIVTHRQGEKEKYYFILHPKMVDLLSIYIRDMKIDESAENIVLLPAELPENIRESNSFYNRYVNSIAICKYVQEMAIIIAANRIIMMQFDTFQFAIGSKLIGSKDCFVEGIFFYPGTANYKKNDSKSYRLEDKLKTFYIRWMLRNSYLKTVFILNDTNLVKHLNNYFSTKIFKLLPDPVSTHPIKTKRNLRKIYNLPNDSFVFITFGAMSARKNIANIIKAFAILLNNPQSPKVSLLILGQFIDPDYRNAVGSLIEEIVNEETENCIQIDNRFLTDDEREVVFRDTDAVLIPYVDFQGSSGVLGHAAKNKKPVIVSRGGLMEDLTNQYQLGYTVNQSDVYDIANKMGEAMKYNSTNNREINFLHERSPICFAERLLSKKT